MVDNSTPEWSDQPEEEPMSIRATKLLNNGNPIFLIDADDEDIRLIKAL